MRKKYEQSKKDRRDEREGMERYERKRRSEHEGDRSHVMGLDPSWGRGDHANMPSKLEMSSYPRGQEGGRGDLDDTIRDVDRTFDQAERVRYSDISYQK